MTPDPAETLTLLPESTPVCVHLCCRLQACRITARPGDRAMRIILKEFFFMQGLEVTLIRNTAIVDFAQ